jgi:hypothetical protein
MMYMLLIGLTVNQYIIKKNFLRNGARVEFIASMKVPGAPVRPNGITRN